MLWADVKIIEAFKEVLHQSRGARCRLIWAFVLRTWRICPNPKALNCPWCFMTVRLVCLSGLASEKNCIHYTQCKFLFDAAKWSSCTLRCLLLLWRNQQLAVDTLGGLMPCVVCQSDWSTMNTVDAVLLGAKRLQFAPIISRPYYYL